MASKSSQSRSRSKGRVTLSDVASMAGVSSMTVSRALNDPERVSEQVRSRVREAVEALGYIPNRAARSLAGQRSYSIAVVIPSVSNAVFSNVIKGIYDVCSARGYEILMGNTYYSVQQESSLIAKFLTHHPDGLIVTGLNMADSARALLQGAGIPVVQLMEVGEAEPIDLNVGISHRDAGAAMARYMLDRGYRRIGVLGAQMDYRAQRRIQGFVNVLADAGRYDEARIVTTSEPSTVHLGGQLLGDLLSAAPDTDAVFCINDDLAYGVIYECQRRHIRIPQQLAVAGFNDLEASACINPSLTSVSTPLYEMGRVAAQMLMRRLDGETIEQPVVDLGFELRARESA
ncbi:transcriptional regulator [Marinobacterium nitratireducens]|uniref:Transcriptional regulator n=1 Tax=Marinobacterium nitratireducens TaxID=518897 RepID=A0A918DTJ7_9GAMM|nr:LacI family DNA-binding transcriptional regulator [Marinobacterium nitratireducens]GGO82796.1 transcriptional regulator [Marinobacterium nitratireducens]